MIGGISALVCTSAARYPLIHGGLLPQTVVIGAGAVQTLNYRSCLWNENGDVNWLCVGVYHQSVVFKLN